MGDVMWADWFVVIVVVLAAARVTRAVTVDDVGAPVRRMIGEVFLRVADGWSSRRTDFDNNAAADRHFERVNRWAQHGETLATCPWCTGFWVSVVAVASLLVLDWQWVGWLGLPWAVSYLVGVCEMAVGRLGDEDKD